MCANTRLDRHASLEIDPETRLHPRKLPHLPAYLKQTLIRIPCRFEFKTEGIPGEPPDWQHHAG